jgi:hypothetical protein
LLNNQSRKIYHESRREERLSAIKQTEFLKVRGGCDKVHPTTSEIETGANFNFNVCFRTDGGVAVW